MEGDSFSRLVRDVIEAMGQRLDAARPIAEGMALRTSDGYLYVFVKDVTQGSPQHVHRWCEESGITSDHLVVFSVPGLPSEWESEIREARGRAIARDDFRRLVDELGIESDLVGRDPALHRIIPSALPSAQSLDTEMLRGRSWYDAGVYVLAEKFYGRAAELKPGFLPAWIGLARTQDRRGAKVLAEASWKRILALDPSSVEARLALAQGARERGALEEEIRWYQELLRERPDLVEARAQLLAAFLARRSWDNARSEIEALLRISPEEGRLHFLHALVLERTGVNTAQVEEERREARRLGVTDEAEQDLRRALDASPEPQGA